MARTNNLTDFLTDVADAIRTAEGSSETIQASDFDTRIEALSGGGADLSEYFNLNPTASSIKAHNNWARDNFVNGNSISTLTLTIPIVSTIYTLGGLFRGWTYSSIPEIVFSDNITDMGNMFNGSVSITQIDLSNANMSNVANSMSGTFSNCSSLQTINFGSTHPITKVTNISYIFSNSSQLRKIDMRLFDFSNVTNSTNAFAGVPNNCEIIVKDDTQKNWITSRFSNLTNVKTVAEYEAE